MSERRITQILIVFFFVGILLHLIPFLRIYTEFITDAFLFGANLLVLIQVYARNRQRRLLYLIAGAWIFTFAAEVLGVYTGRVFGVYHYGEAMKLQLLDVPLIIPFNWVMLVLGSVSLARQTKLPGYSVPFLAAAGLVLFDFVMEPVAVFLDYWQWEAGEIPLQNYLAWFGIALLIASVSELAGVRLKSHVLRYYVIIQLVFFLILNLSLKFF